nr:immunoglobulin light chain junction region [Macaca mulatta]
CLQGYSTPYRF